MRKIQELKEKKTTVEEYFKTSAMRAKECAIELQELFEDSFNEIAEATRYTVEFLQEVFTDALMESVDEPIIDIYEEIRGIAMEHDF